MNDHQQSLYQDFIKDKRSMQVFGRRVQKEIADTSTSLVTRFHREQEASFDETIHALLALISSISCEHQVTRRTLFWKKRDPKQTLHMQVERLFPQIEEKTASLERIRLQYLRDLIVLKKEEEILVRQEKELRDHITVARTYLHSITEDDVHYALVLRKVRDLETSHLLVQQLTQQLSIMRTTREKASNAAVTSVIATVPLWKSTIVQQLTKAEINPHLQQTKTQLVGQLEKLATRKEEKE